MEYAARTAPQVGAQVFLQRVFAWMFLGLAVTGLVALVIGDNNTLLTDVTEHPLALLALLIAQLVLVFALSAAIDRLSTPVAAGMFLVYAALNGVLFALIFELYTRESIFTTFLITAAMFGAVALWGATTKRDLSGLGTILIMGVVGLIIATVVNIFVASSALYWLTTYAGVLIFAGLTAYDMQKLTRYADAGVGDRSREESYAIHGALALYLDFINLFLFLLRIFGQSR